MRFLPSYCVALLFFMLAFLRLDAQRFYKPYHLFTIRDGLAKQRVRAFLEDSRGYIWIGTNGGLTRFDGRSLQAYTSQQGFTGKPVYSILEAPDSTIWYRSGKSVYRFDGSTESELPMTPAFWQEQRPYLWPLFTLDIASMLGARFPEIDTLSEGYTHITDTAGAAVIIDWKKRLCHRIHDRCTTTALPPDFPPSGIADPLQKFLICQDNYYTWTEKGLQCVAMYLPDGDSARVLHHSAPDIFHYYDFTKKKYWYRDGSTYRRLDLSSLHFNRLDRIVLDRQRRIHIATDEGYAVMYPDGPERVELPQVDYPWSVQPGGKGGVYIGSRLNGIVFLSPGKAQQVRYPLPLNESEHQVFPGKVHGPEGALLFGGYKGFYHLEAGQAELFHLGEPIEALCWDAARQRYLVAGQQIYCVNPSLDKVLQTISLPPKLLQEAGLSDLDVAADGSIWATGRGGILHLQPNGEITHLYSFSGRSNCLLIDSSGMIWMGGDQGLIYLNPSTKQRINATDSLINKPVNNLIQLPNQHLAVVTDTEVLLLDLGRPDKPILKGYWSEENGFQLLESIANGACYDGTFLWIPSGNGIQRINLARQIQLSAIRPGLRLDRVNHERMAFGQTASIGNVYGNSVDVDLSLINLIAGNFIVEYSVNGSEWQQDNKLINLHVVGLQHGENILLFRVRIPMIDPDDWPYANATVRAELPIMHRPIMKWFLWGGAIFLAIILSYLVLKRKREKELQALLDQTQLATVQAQLNPHILFNLLSSLQNSIANRNKEAASEHLVRIARLIREILELSIAPDKNATYKFPVISLDEEIRFLHNYLKLEAMQHSPNFEYEIRNEVAAAPESIAIPPLLVQPLAENAVIHGIQPNTGKTGLIRIVFREDGAHLVISVEDNGVGLLESSEGRQPLFRYRSRGGELLQKRLNLMDKLGFSATWSIHYKTAGGAVAEIRIRKMEI